MKLSPLNQRRWRNFRRNSRAFWSLVIFAVLFVLSLLAEVIANDKPIVVGYRGELYFPAYRFYPETTFGGDFGTEANYKDPVVQCLIASGGMEVCLDTPEDTLAGLGLPRVLTEGGPSLLGALISAGLLDELCLTIAPTLVGGSAKRITDGHDEAITAAGGRPAEAVALLALVAGQDVEPAEDSDGTDGRWRIARRTAPDRVISTVDPDARHAHKTQQRRQDGFKAHIVVEPDTGLTTATRLTRASGPDNSDATVGADLVTTDPTTTDVEHIEVLGDSAYATGDMLATLAGKQWLPLVKPWPTRPAVEGGFGLDDFTFDAAANTLTCPADVTRTVSPQGRAKFGAACRQCPLRQRCTTSQSGRSVLLGEHHVLQRQHRQRAGDEDFKTVYRQHRPMVERSIAWLTRGARRVPYRGVEKNNTWLHHRVAALNLRRLLAMGLTNQNGTWALA